MGPHAAISQAGSPSLTYLAHVRRNEDGSFATHDLEEHLREVGRLAGAFAWSFGQREWGYLAGLWHDLGKYTSAFQSYLARESGYEKQEAHIEGGKGRVNHSSARALHAREQLGARGTLLAYLIAGHHAGLPDWYSQERALSSLSQRVEERTHLRLISDAAIPLMCFIPRLIRSVNP